MLARKSGVWLAQIGRRMPADSVSDHKCDETEDHSDHTQVRSGSCVARMWAQDAWQVLTGNS